MNKRLYYSLDDINCYLKGNKLKEVKFQPGEFELLIGPREYGHIKPVRFPVEHTITLYYEGNMVEEYVALTDYEIGSEFLKNVSNLDAWKVALENIQIVDNVKEFILCGVKFKASSYWIDAEQFLYDEATKYLAP